MPKLTKDFPITIVFRARESDGKKLAALAQLTGRGQGEVLRLLLNQAVVAEKPDIQLVGATTSVHARKGRSACRLIVGLTQRWPRNSRSLGHQVVCSSGVTAHGDDHDK